MLKHIVTGALVTVVLAVLTGLIFPLGMTLIAQLAFPLQANGSLITNSSGQVIGSRLIGQGFAKPQYFHPRPSAAGAGYAGESSGGTNYGPTSKKLILGDKDFAGIKQLADSYRKENSLSFDAKVPVDAVTRSASGLDPDITYANAMTQAVRVAKARHLPEQAIMSLVRTNLEIPQLGFLGEPRVNVLQLNLALDKLKQ
jgi:K+-transporting ATPase ATPase C chain